MKSPVRRLPVFFTLLLLAGNTIFAASVVDPYMSSGRKADSTAKTLSEIRAAEKRRIPLDVSIKAFAEYPVNQPVLVSVMITNLFDSPILLNKRMLVNHPKLQGELSFYIIDPSGKKLEIERLITPLSMRDEDFVLLNRGESVMRTVDLKDLYGFTQKGPYAIQVNYHNDVDEVFESYRAWKGAVNSPPAVIILK